MPVSVARPVATALAGSAPLPRGVSVEKTELAGMPAERLVPTNATRHGLVMLYLHGGAFRIGSARMYRGLVAQLAKHGRCETFAVDYRLAPEHAFPAAHDDALAAARALLALRPDARLVIAGDSAGGGLALCTAQRLRDAGETRVAGLVLISPWIDMTLGSESARTKDDVDPMLSREGLLFAAGDYLRGHAASSPEASPLFGSLENLPPMHVEVGTDEVLLDDAVALAQRGRAAGIEVTLRVVDGMWHDFPLHAGLLPEADAALGRIGAFVDALARG